MRLRCGEICRRVHQTPMAGHSSITIPLCSAPESHESPPPIPPCPFAKYVWLWRAKPAGMVMEALCQPSELFNSKASRPNVVPTNPRRSKMRLCCGEICRPSKVGLCFGTKSNRIKIYYALKSHVKAKLKLQAKIRQINHIITSSSRACPHKTPAPTIGLVHRASRESPRNEPPRELGTSRSAKQPATNNRLQ